MECASKLVLFYKFRKKIETSQITLSATLETMKIEQLDDKDGIEIIEQTVEIDDDQYRYDCVNEMYEQDFVNLDDVIEETYTEVTSDQHSINELIVDNVEETTTYVVLKKKVRKQTNHQCDECGRVFTVRILHCSWDDETVK